MIKESLKKADTQSSRSASHAYLRIDAVTNKCFQPKCKTLRNILINDANNCSMRYLVNCWNIQKDKCRGDTGIEMINYSSEMIVIGDNINKYSRPTW